MKCQTAGQTKRGAVRALVATCAFLFALMIPGTAFAGLGLNPDPNASIDDFKGTVTVYMMGGKNDRGIGGYYKLNKGKIKDIMSSNINVVQAFSYYSDTSSTNPAGLHIVGIKPGKAKVSFVYKGKKRVVNVVVKKYVNPIKSMKLGGKETRGRFKTSSYATVNTLGGKKLEAKPAKGWKLKAIYGYKYNETKHITYLSGRIKNGAKVPKKCIMCVVVFQNIKTGGYALSVLSTV